MKNYPTIFLQTTFLRYKIKEYINYGIKRSIQKPWTFT
jgi:hypothetical protein